MLCDVYGVHIESDEVGDGIMLDRYGRFIVRRARLLLVISGVVLIAASVFGSGAFGALKNGGFDDSASQSSQAQRMIDERRPP